MPTVFGSSVERSIEDQTKIIASMCGTQESVSKTCNICGQTKLIADFQKHKTTSDGCRPECKACTREYRREYYRKNRESVLTKAKQYFVENRESICENTREWAQNNKERKAASDKACAAANADKIREYNKARRQIKGDQIREYDRQRAKDNPERVRVSAVNRAARDRAAEGKIRSADVKAVVLEQRGLCAICGTPMTQYHVDHIIPLSKGGTNLRDNIQLTHPKCNMSKSSKDPVVYAAELGNEELLLKYMLR